MIAYVPYLVAIAASLVLLRLPRGFDLVVIVFFIPWAALVVDIGVSLSVHEMLMIVALAKYTIAGQFNLTRLPGAIFFLAFAGLAVVMAIHSIEFGPEVPELAGGGFFRNDYGRLITSLIKLVIVFGFLSLVVGNRDAIEPSPFLKTFVMSCSVLALLGLVQYVVFSVTNIDLFPIGMFHAGDGTGRTASVLFGDTQIIRVNSFGGEPKGLGQSLAIALCILVVFAREIGWSRSVTVTLGLLLLIVIFTTASTSAFFVLVVVAAFYAAFSKWPHPFPRLMVALILIVSSYGVSAVYYWFASQFDIQPGYYQAYVSYFGSVIDRMTSRLRLDDTDHLIMEGFIGDYIGLIFGRGLGLAHYYSIDKIPNFMQYYLSGQILVPKSGVSFFVGYSGLLGLTLVVLMLSRFIPVAGILGPYTNKDAVDLVCRCQAICFGLFAALMLRLYTFDATWTIFAVVYVIGYKLHLVTHGQERAGSRVPDTEGNVRYAGARA